MSVAEGGRFTVALDLLEHMKPHGGRERCLQGSCWEARRQETAGKT
jgi:hypothetical protein